MIEIVPYSERWPVEFSQIADRLRDELGRQALRIDHIGSTSVPGLAAKDVIDVQVTVSTLGDAAPLVGRGYREWSGFRDHRPPGADGPEEDWSKRGFSAPEGRRRANIHVRVAERANQRYALLFRDYLRVHAAAAEAYSELKRRLAAELRNPELYPEVKDPACDLIAIAAEEWAAATGWTPGPSDG